MSKIDYDFFNIDKNRLDEEWINQPRFYMQYAEKLARASKKVEQAKTAVKVAEAELNKKVRGNPGKYVGDDTRDAAIKAEVTIRLAKHKSTKKLQDAEYKKDLLQAAVVALDHRKRALQDLVALHGQNYFSTPQAKGEAAQEGIKKIQQRKQARRSGGRK